MWDGFWVRTAVRLLVTYAIYHICKFKSVWKSHQNAPFEQSFSKNSAFHSEFTLCFSFQFTLCLCLVAFVNDLIIYLFLVLIMFSLVSIYS